MPGHPPFPKADKPAGLPPAAVIVFVVLVALVVVSCTQVLLEADARNEHRRAVEDFAVRKFRADHRCRRDTYDAHGNVVFRCDNGVWTEWDIRRELGLLG